MYSLPFYTLMTHSQIPTYPYMSFDTTVSLNMLRTSHIKMIRQTIIFHDLQSTLYNLGVWKRPEDKK